MRWMPICVPSGVDSEPGVAEPPPGAQAGADYRQRATIDTGDGELAYTTDARADVMFGHLAMRAALDSHKSHYEKARHRLRPKE